MAAGSNLKLVLFLKIQSSTESSGSHNPPNRKSGKTVKNTKKILREFNNLTQHR